MPDTTASADRADRVGLRDSHGVRLVEAGEEGGAAERLPNGVYGFTYAPQEAAVPLFGKQSWHSFEIHKLADGALHLVGFVSPADSRFIESGEHVEATVYPDPWEEATTLVSIPMTRVVPSKRGPSREGGNGLKIELL
jgi:hypothetical protein